MPDDEMTSRRKLDSLRPITPAMREDLASLYREIFSGHPWHEEYLCTNEKCPQALHLYTTRPCDRVDAGPQGNDCRDGFKRRPGISLVAATDLRCSGCSSALTAYYPDHVDHHSLLENAMSKEAYVGYVGFLNENMVGFSFGYRVPELDTESVAFSQVRALLSERGIEAAIAFYAAETGITGECQKSGYGTVLSGRRLLGAYDKGFRHVVTRTLNPYVFRYFRRYFGGRSEQFLFNDPVKGTSKWFAWDMGYFDQDATSELVREGCKGEAGERDERA